MTVEILKEKWSGSVRAVTLGSAGGGTRTSTVTVGGQDGLPFLHYEAGMPNRPAVAVEVVDRYPEEWSPELLAAWGDDARDPAAWAKKAVRGVEDVDENNPSATRWVILRALNNARKEKKTVQDDIETLKTQASNSSTTSTSHTQCHSQIRDLRAKLSTEKAAHIDDIHRIITATTSQANGRQSAKATKEMSGVHLFCFNLKTKRYAYVSWGTTVFDDSV